VFLEVLTPCEQFVRKTVLIMNGLERKRLCGDNSEYLDVHLVFFDEAGQTGDRAREGFVVKPAH